MKPRKPLSLSGRGLRPLRSIEDRFWDKVIRHDEGCWEWTGKPDRNGYGELTGGRYAERNLHRVRANRLSWEIHNGPIPEGLWVLHHCDNPPCTNPAHLYLGTAADNARDRTVRRRMPSDRQTHCVNGHEFTEANTRYEEGPSGRRYRRCRRCHSARVVATKKRKREAARVAAGTPGPASKEHAMTPDNPNVLITRPPTAITACTDPGHNPPALRIGQGAYTHTCPGCGYSFSFSGYILAQ